MLYCTMAQYDDDDHKKRTLTFFFAGYGSSWQMSWLQVQSERLGHDAIQMHHFVNKMKEIHFSELFSVLHHLPDFSFFFCKGCRVSTFIYCSKQVCVGAPLKQIHTTYKIDNCSSEHFFLCNFAQDQSKPGQ